jgi:hypothetical protein
LQEFDMGTGHRVILWDLESTVEGGVILLSSELICPYQ